MKSLSILYENDSSVQELVASGAISPELPYFVQILTANQSPEEAVATAQLVQRLLPHAQIIGSSASGVIYHGDQYPDGTLILFRLFDATEVITATFTWENKPAAQVAQEVADRFAGHDVKLMHLLCGDHYYDVNDFTEAFNHVAGQVTLVGGIAGDIISTGQSGYVFTPDGVIPNGIVAAGLCGEALHYYNGVNTSHEAISGKHRLTDCDGSVWKTINGKDIRSWLIDQLGIETLIDYSDWQVLCANDVMVRFPLILENHGGSSRFLRYDQSLDSITQYFSRLPQGTEFRIGYVSPSECVKQSFRLCNEIMEQPIEDLFCYSCLFRRLYLHNCAEWELSPYRSADLCGAFLMGEISRIEHSNEFLNGACCMVGLAEHEVYIRPNISVFDKLESIQDEAKDLLNIVLKRQREETSRANEELLAKLVSQQESQRELIYVDFNTGVPNYLKYKEDRKTTHFDKLCMIKIENADLMLTHLGHNAYLRIIRSAMDQIRGFMQTTFIQEREMLSIYIFNESSFFLTSDERMSVNHFLRVCNALFEKYHFIQTSEQNETLVNRYAVALHQKDLIESALNSLIASKNVQTPFLVCRQEEDSGFSSEEEFHMIGVLNRALENDGIIPYFQGIYDNYEKKITRYEALMRIRDLDGLLYPPARFMGVAKKYHMYDLLSRRMIEKVFSLFAHRPETIEMNLSVFDVQSEQMQALVFDKLASCTDPSRFVLEILEDEEYRDFGPLRKFITRIKELGARVAIDDFGAGYSNLLEISSINFDIIKVDGSIIRSLPTNTLNQKLLDVITHMGHLFNAEIVAEFVENEAIQRMLEQTDIRYSQGYYFAIPISFEELHLPILP